MPAGTVGKDRGRAGTEFGASRGARAYRAGGGRAPIADRAVPIADRGAPSSGERARSVGALASERRAQRRSRLNAAFALIGVAALIAALIVATIAPPAHAGQMHKARTRAAERR
jgi:hypothetical protein